MKNILKANKTLGFLTFSLLRGAICLGAVAVIVTFWVLLPCAGKTPKLLGSEFAVHFLDVGHGDCAIVRTPDNKTFVIDGGEGSVYPKIKNYLETIVKVRSIDYMINTHPHADHCGGLVGVLRDFSVDTVYRPITRSTSSYEVPQSREATHNTGKPDVIYDNFITESYKQAHNVEFIVAGIILEGEGWELTFHTPDEEGIINGLRYINEISPIMTLEYENKVFVLTGDAGANGGTSSPEARFAAQPRAHEIFGDGRATVLKTYLKVGHHGSNTASGDQFLDFIKPDIAIVSVGTRYPTLPNTQALQRIADAGAETYITRDSGNIVFTFGDIEQIIIGNYNAVNLSFIYVLALFTSVVICFTIKGRSNA